MRSSAVQAAVARHLRADDPVRFGVVGDDADVEVVVVVQQRDLGAFGGPVPARAAAESSSPIFGALFHAVSSSAPSMVMASVVAVTTAVGARMSWHPAGEPRRPVAPRGSSTPRAPRVR